MAGDGGPHRHNCRGEINYLHTAPSSAAGASQDSDMDITPSLKRSRESSIQSNHQGPLTHCVVQKNIKVSNISLKFLSFSIVLCIGYCSKIEKKKSTRNGKTIL